MQGWMDIARWLLSLPAGPTAALGSSTGHGEQQKEGKKERMVEGSSEICLAARPPASPPRAELRLGSTPARSLEVALVK